MKLFNLFVTCSLTALLSSPVAMAQEDDVAVTQEDFSRKRIEIVRTDLVPEIDGILDDEIWKRATVITDMHQFQPVDHGEPSEKTEFYIAYDERFFYLGARLYDSNPEGISARQMIQGQGMPFDDAFEFILDTFNNGRTGYHFQVNPNGIRREGVFENPNSLNRDWTGIWRVESRIDALGWTAEVAIPFNTLNFDPNSEEWGFTVARTIARKQEELAWSSFNRNLNPTTTGLLMGIHDIKQGLGLDIIPSFAVARAKDFKAGVTEKRFDPSVNIFYKFTPSLTGALTVNTDFSATEVDNRQINLTRFSLFFPEKRDFFLQDVDIFSFGGLNQNGIPFFSRQIGLSGSGQPVDIEAGLKLTGRVGRWNVGGLGVQQAADGDVDSQTVFVGRAAANVLSESSIGAIFTRGDPGSNTNNSLLGTDFRYQNTRFSESHSLRGNAWYQQSDTQGISGDDKAYGINANFDTQGTGFGGFVGYEYFGEQFNPGLGFTNRTGVESLNMDLSGRYFLDEHPLIRNLFTFMRFNHTRTLDTHELQSENFFFRYFSLNTHLGDQFNLSYQRNREGLQAPFEISEGVVIPPGKYSFDNVQMEIDFSDQRLLAPSFRISQGDFFEGERLQLRGGLNWRPDEHFFFSANYDYQDIDLPQGNFVTRLVSINANYAFSSKWSWINLIQYDNGSDSVGINSRLRWNPQAGEDLFLVLNYNLDARGTFSGLSSNSSEIVLKYSRTFRF
ncbi:MAG: DUF5916 domain-containing protein [Pseudomonadales bacterium]|nr:DUF5916 domain-containing protein [Pseudomonadales bacterium]